MTRRDAPASPASRESSTEHVWTGATRVRVSEQIQAGDSITPLPVVERRRVEAAEPGWPRPPHSAACVHPRCQRRSEQRHHAVARSVLFGAYDYVYIDDERVINVIDLCDKHHDMLESKPGGCRSRLRWVDSDWAWYDRVIPDDERTRILWVDPKHKSIWALIGFVKGEYLCAA